VQPRVGAAVDDLASALAAARRRLIPFLFLLYIVAYVDRINIGIASLQMNRALGFSATTYGFGAGIFFLSYVIFEIPSNMILARIGARVWIARIMISWGLVSVGMMFVRSAPALYVLRFLLGAAEAGFFPGIIFYLTHWFPERQRARAFALFMTAVFGAGVIGAPISGALLTLDGVGGLGGWQWLFLLEGLPAVILGVIVLRVLVEGPDEARWLTASEREALSMAIATEAAHAFSHDAGVALRSRRTWMLAASYFIIPVTLYGIGFWLPQMIKIAARTSSDFTVGLLAAIPYACGMIAMVVIGRLSDRTGERRRYVFAAALVTAAGLVLAAYGSTVLWTVAVLSIVLAGVGSMLGPFWALATASIRGVGAAAAIALINSVGNTGGFVGPYLVGAINDATHSFIAGLLAIAAMVAIGGSLVLLVQEK
jgi:ACS family tartrate transporter-like MFS transporter